MKYLKLFEKQTDYQSFLESDSFVTPNVSFVKEESTVFCNPYEEEEILSTRMITYTANSKLTETTGDYYAGLNTNAFNTTIASHEFIDGVGTIVFEEDVTSIGKEAFFRCDSLTSVTIPDSVTSIGTYAFYCCSSLTSINIPDSVTSIGGSAFSECSSLTSITIPDSVTSIGGSAFSECSSLTSITIPDSVTKIEDNLFYYCSGLISIVIPDSVTSLASNVFDGCSSLTSITCYAITAPTIYKYTFEGTGGENGGVLYYPAGSDYSEWLLKLPYIWTGQEITA